MKWAWEVRKWENTDWDEFGNATKGEWRQTYRALTIPISDDDYVDISPPRWILEERFEPEAIAQSWEMTRYRLKVVEPVPVACRYCQNAGRFFSLAELASIFARWDASQVVAGEKVFVHWVDTDKSEGHVLACRFCSEDTFLRTVRQDVWGEVPREGWYNLLPHIGIIADHTLTCCKEARDLGEICYGTYALPSDRELNRLKRAIAKRNKDAATNPHIRPDLDPVQLEQAKQWGLQMMQDREVQRRGEMAEIRREHSKPNLVYSM